jgi:hypothetical protein
LPGIVIEAKVGEQFCTDEKRSLVQTARMAIIDWYVYQAERCSNLAKEASDPDKRATFEQERKLWLQIAEKIENDPAVIRQLSAGMRMREEEG